MTMPSTTPWFLRGAARTAASEPLQRRLRAWFVQWVAARWEAACRRAERPGRHVPYY